MPRRKSAATAASSNPASTETHKRQLSMLATEVTLTPGSRASKRLKATRTNGKTTPKKSQYFQASDDAEYENLSSEDVSQSGYEDEDISATELSPSASEAENDYESEKDARNHKQPGRKSTAVASEVKHGGRALWREGVKAGLGPGKQIFIEKPKPRSDGGIKYVPDRIHRNTMAFLADLQNNNDREWLKMHDPDYRQSWNDWTTFVESITAKISEIDETIPELPPKDLVFRIYRDIRFSSDPTPYKTHFSAAWSRTGRKGPFACYYVQIQPGGKSFVGGGLWHPEAQPLALLRRDIDRKPHRIRNVLTDARIRKEMLGVGKDERKAIKAFASSNAENALKTKPKGYEADNANIELLRLRNFTIGKRLTDKEIADPAALETIANLVLTMRPFVTYLNSVVMPDDDNASSSDEGGSETGEHAEGEEEEEEGEEA